MSRCSSFQLLLDQTVKIRHAAEFWIDGEVIADIVTKIAVG